MLQTLLEIHCRHRLRTPAIKIGLIQAQIHRHIHHLKTVPTQHATAQTQLAARHLQETALIKTVQIQLPTRGRLRTRVILPKAHLNRLRMAATRSQTDHRLLDQLHLDQQELHQLDQVTLAVQVDLPVSLLIHKALPILQEVLRHHLQGIDL